MKVYTAGRSRWSIAVCMVFALVCGLVALPLIWGGVHLLTLGGSPYYILAGVAFLATALLFSMGRRSGLWLLLITFMATFVWAIIEAGTDFWQLLPRLVVPAIICMLGLWTAPFLAPDLRRSVKISMVVSGVVFMIALSGTLWAAFYPQGALFGDEQTSTQRAAFAEPNPAGENWQYFGRSGAGTRFAPFSQINPDNVKDLEIAWTYRTGRQITGADAGVDQNTVLQIGSTVFHCTPHNVVHAINADTGEARWVFDPEAKSEQYQRCRGLGYFDSSASGGAQLADEICPTRIVLTTIDARLMTINAETGELCTDFGVNGSVDLTDGMGDRERGLNYHPTSAPTVMGQCVIVGGWVWDNIKVGQPSGAVRAFNVRTGVLEWAWDLGDVANSKEGFTQGTPNVWSTPAFDANLDMLYIPTGNATPDYWGAHRSPEMEQYASSVVALNASTGVPVWSFQTVHHDIWDYDVATQPALIDLPIDGTTVPALVQATKRGQIFLLDRRTGKALAEVEERPVPQEPVWEGDHLSTTQPYSVGMPSIGTEPLTEEDMWGTSMFDQLWCRISFRSLRYQGEFTAPGGKILIWPGILGGMNWGGVSIDEQARRLFVNSISVGMVVETVPRAQVDAAINSSTGSIDPHLGIDPQVGTPFGVKVGMFFSPLGVPCTRPPFGELTAIDLDTRQIAWQVPLGSVEDSGPFGIKTGLHIPLGMPSLGGPTSTAGGIVFYAGSQDYYLRAIDSATGKELWRGRLPIGAVSAPTVFVSPDTGRQYVVVSAGGTSYSPERGDYVVAFALPEHN